MERILQFLPSILFFGVIAGSLQLHFRRLKKRHGEKLKDLEWIDENKKRLFWEIRVPALLVFAPALEELVFRAPLIIGFELLSSSAWIAIVISSMAFGAIHWGGIKLTRTELIHRVKQNDSSQEVSPRAVLLRRVLHVVFSFGFVVF